MKVLKFLGKFLAVLYAIFFTIILNVLLTLVCMSTILKDNFYERLIDSIDFSNIDLTKYIDFNGIIEDTVSNMDGNVNITIENEDELREALKEKNIDLDELEEVLQNESVKKEISKFLSKTVSYIATQEEVPQINKETIDNAIDKANVKGKEEMKSFMNSSIDKINEVMTNEFEEKVKSIQKPAIIDKILKIASGNKLLYGTIIFIIGSYILCAFLLWDFNKSIKCIAIPSIVVGVFFLISKLLFNGILNALLNNNFKFVEPFIPVIVKPIFNISLICIIGGILLLILSSIISKKIEENKLNDKVITEGE